MLKQVDVLVKVEDVCREYGISSATYDNWQSKCGGMEASYPCRMKDLERENERLKRMFTDLCLIHEASKWLIEKELSTKGT